MERIPIDMGHRVKIGKLSNQEKERRRRKEAARLAPYTDNRPRRWTINKRLQACGMRQFDLEGMFDTHQMEPHERDEHMRAVVRGVWKEDAAFNIFKLLNVGRIYQTPPDDAIELLAFRMGCEALWKEMSDDGKAEFVRDIDALMQWGMEALHALFPGELEVTKQVSRSRVSQTVGQSEEIIRDLNHRFGPGRYKEDAIVIQEDEADLRARMGRSREHVVVIDDEDEKDMGKRRMELIVIDDDDEQDMESTHLGLPVIREDEAPPLSKRQKKRQEKKAREEKTRLAVIDEDGALALTKKQKRRKQRKARRMETRLAVMRDDAIEEGEIRGDGEGMENRKTNLVVIDEDGEEVGNMTIDLATIEEDDLEEGEIREDDEDMGEGNMNLTTLDSAAFKASKIKGAVFKEDLDEMRKRYGNLVVINENGKQMGNTTLDSAAFKEGKIKEAGIKQDEEEKRNENVDLAIPQRKIVIVIDD